MVVTAVLSVSGTQELLPLSPSLQCSSQEVRGHIRELGSFSVAVDGFLQHVVTAQPLSQVVLCLPHTHTLLLNSVLAQYWRSIL